MEDDNKVPRYNITIHTGTDYQIDLSLVADDDTELSNYGALIYDEILRDGSGSVMDTDNERLDCSDDWDISDEVMIYTGSGEIIVGSWELEAQLREFEEASDHFDFDISVDTDGYKLTMSNELTQLIPWSQGVYDVFITNVETGVRSKLLMGDAKIVRRTTR